MPPKTFKRKGGAGGNSMGAAMKAAFQQRDSTQIVINSTESVTLAVPANTTGSTVVRNVTKLLCSTEFFHHYAARYDQFKIDGVSVSAEIVFNTVGQAALTYPNVISAWDRNGIDKATTRVVPNGSNVGIDAFVVPGPYQVASYSSAVSRAFYPGSRWGITRRLVASSLQEKSIYLPTVKTAEVMTESGLYAAWNPDFLLSCLLGGNTPTCQSLVFNLSWSWVLTLRGLRKTSLDVIPTPLAGTVGYAPTNVGTIASGTDNAMIPAVRTEVGAGGVVTTTPYYTTNMQGLSGTQLSSGSWTNEGFKLSVNNLTYLANGMDIVYYNFNEMTEKVVNDDIVIPPGNAGKVSCRLVLFCSNQDMGSQMGYHVQPVLYANVADGGDDDDDRTMTVTLGGVHAKHKVFASDVFYVYLENPLLVDGTVINFTPSVVLTTGGCTSPLKFKGQLGYNATSQDYNINFDDDDPFVPERSRGASVLTCQPVFASSVWTNNGTVLLPLRQ